MSEPKKRTRAQVGKYSRTKGHTMERQIVKEFKELGYDQARTARAESKTLDDCKVDIANVPYNIQSKNTVSKVKYSELFKEMRDLLGKNRRDRLDYPMVCFHKISRTEDYVVMERKEFYKLVAKLWHYDIIKAPNNAR